MPSVHLDIVESSPALGDLRWLAGLFGSLAHPLRLRMLWVCADCALSAKEFARDFDVTLGVAAYHVRRLRAAGLLELVGRRPARGSVESFYRLSDGGRLALAVLEAGFGAGRSGGEAWALLERAAARAGVSVAEYVRAVVFGDVASPESGSADAMVRVVGVLGALTRLEAGSTRADAAALRAESRQARRQAATLQEALRDRPSASA